MENKYQQTHSAIHSTRSTDATVQPDETLLPLTWLSNAKWILS